MKIVLRALEKERERRQQSAGEVKTQVETIENSPAPTPRRRRLQVGGWKLAALLVIAGALPLGLLFTLISWNARTGNVANNPFRLKSLPTARVIEAGLSNPDAPWAWQELEKRAQSGRLNTGEANALLDGLTARMRRDYPHGYNDSLPWLRGLFGELSRSHLASEDRVLQFLDAYGGVPRCELDRTRETNRTVRFTCHLKSMLHEDLFGLVWLNEVRSIAIDGRGVSATSDFGTNWNAQFFSGDLQLPVLAPGEHTVTFEIESALVPRDLMAGFPGDARFKDWPPARRRWTRTAQTNLTVFASTDEIVRLVHDPALSPVAQGTLSFKQAVVRRFRDKVAVTIVLDPSTRNVFLTNSVPISFDVSLRVAGQTHLCGRLWKSVNLFGQSYGGGNRAGTELAVVIEPLDPQLKEAEVVLTPNPRLVESIPSIQQIWGDEIVLHVPLLRLDHD